MLEILAIVWLTRRLAEIADTKGRSKAWAALGVLFWFAGELIGLIIGGILGMELGAYGIAVVCAAAGAGLAWMIVNGLSGNESTPYTMDAGGVEPEFQDPNNPFNPPGL